MNRRNFLQWLGLGTVAGIAGLLTGCAIRTINSSVTKKPKEQPWRCGNCGLLLRADKDLSHSHCPRCYKKMMYKISEAELAEYMKAPQQK